MFVVLACLILIALIYWLDHVAGKERKAREGERTLIVTVKGPRDEVQRTLEDILALDFLEEAQLGEGYFEEEAERAEEVIALEEDEEE